jgi:dihydroorotase
MNDTWLIRNGRVVDPRSGTDGVADLAVRAGRFVAPDSLANEPVEVVDAAGLVIVPGFIDLHVHFRDPGLPEAETFETGARAAARGGFTRVLAMPNTTPPVDTPERVNQARARAAALPVAVEHSACLTRGRTGADVADLPGLAAAGAAAFTDDGATVPDEALMRRALEIAARLGIPVLDHALDPALAADGVIHEGVVSRRLGLPGISSEAEIRCVARDIRLCRETGCPIHIQHVSTREAAALIREARKAGLPVTGEATPHHLALTEADITPESTSLKINPPVRTEADRQALIDAVCDGTLTVLATDHAPHPQAAKARGLRAAPFGAVGLETAVGVTHTVLVVSGRMSLPEWVRRWTSGPASVLGRPTPDFSIGAPADLTVLDLDREWVVRSDAFASRSRNTPFEGRRLRGRAVMTFRSGRLAWSEAAIDNPRLF